MTDKVQKIREEVARMHNLLPVVDGDNIYLNYADRICTTLEMYIDSLQEEPVSENLENAALMHFKDVMEYEIKTGLKMANITSFKFGAKWQKENLWKPADGDDLPEIDREVISLLDNGKVVFAHRPPEYWDGKNIATGKITRNYPKTYDKGGWNIPDVKWWLDCSMPKVEED